MMKTKTHIFKFKTCMADYVVDNPEPFIVQGKHGGDVVVAHHLIQYHSETIDGEVRGQKMDQPILTVDGANLPELCGKKYESMKELDADIAI